MQMSNKQKKSTDTPLWIRVICGVMGGLMIIGVLVAVIPYAAQSMVYAAEVEDQIESSFPTDSMIGVGLYCDSEAVASFALESEGGFNLAYRKSDSESDLLFNYPDSELTVAVDANLYRYGSGLTTENLGITALGGYHVQISYFTFSDLGIDDRDNPVYIKPGVASVVTDGYKRDSVNDQIELLASMSEIQALGQPIFPYYTTNKTYIRFGSYYTAEEAERALDALEDILTINAEVVSPSRKALTVFDSSTWTPVCELSIERNVLSLSTESDATIADQAGHRYCGSLLFDREEEASEYMMQVVNRLPLEEYVAALLSYEVSSEENAEFLKAMAIVLRTEAIRHIDAHDADGYDVCCDSHCHRFSGSTSNAASVRKAVLETVGLILTYEGQPIYTPFTTESGSSTISSEAAFGSAIAYLPSIYTPWEVENERWNVEISPYELYSLLIEAGYTDMKGNVTSVSATQTADSSDYVTEITFTDQFGNSVAVSGSETIRALFGGMLPSTNFVVGKAGEEVTVLRRTLSGEGIEYVESTETILLQGAYDSIVFSGRGSGCGVGLSISGARALAEKGYTYEQLLAIYYPETEIE